MDDTHNTTPWYRQFWPWFIMALPATAVVASLYTVSLAVRTSDSLVIPNDEGVDVVTERILDAERRARDLSLVANLSVDAESGAIAVELKSEEAIDAPPTLELLFSHPTDVRRDQLLTLSSALPGDDGSLRWVGHFVDVPTGRWYVVLSSGNDWRLSATWHSVERLIMTPASTGDGA